TPPRTHQDLDSTLRDKKVDGGKECRMPRIARSERGAVSKKRPDSDFPCRIPGDGTLQKTQKAANGNFFRMPSTLLPFLNSDRLGAVVFLHEGHDVLREFVRESILHGLHRCPEHGRRC